MLPFILYSLEPFLQTALSYLIKVDDAVPSIKESHTVLGLQVAMHHSTLVEMLNRACKALEDEADVVVWEPAAALLRHSLQ